MQLVAVDETGRATSRLAASSPSSPWASRQPTAGLASAGLATAHPGIGHISFTGSVEVGRISHAAAEHLIPVTMAGRPDATGHALTTEAELRANPLMFR